MAALAAQSTTTLETWETSSTASTVWGPGTLSGKAIKALGEATLRGVDKLIIRWKMVTISSSLPRSKHEEAPSAEKLERIYDDVLELSRLDYYDYKVRQRALRLIMIQIGSLETTQLVKCIVKWPTEEICIFLSELYPCMAQLREPQDDVRSELIHVYVSSQSESSGGDEIIPFLHFVRHLAEESSDACEALLTSGLLDLFLEIYEHHSLDIGPVSGEDRISSPTMDACSSILAVFVTHPPSLALIASHPVRDSLWPQRYKTAYLDLISRILASFTPELRKETWSKMKYETIVDRFCEIQVIMSFQPVPTSLSPQICLDLVTFLTSAGEVNFKQSVLHVLLQCIAIGRHFWPSLRKALLLCGYEDILDFFYRITYSLSKSPTDPSPTSSIFAKEVDTYNPELSPIDVFADFALAIADCEALARPLVDAEFLTLLTATRYKGSAQADLYAGLQRTMSRGREAFV